MLYYLLYSLHDVFSGFNVFRYITFRAGIAAITAFLLSLILGPHIIRKLTLLKVGENIRKEECPALYNVQSHKQGTPTMGGILIIGAILISVFLWADLSNGYILMALVAALWLGLLGFKDDYLKLVHRKSQGLKPKGLSAGQKLFWQALLALIIAVFLLSSGDFSTALDIPFLKDLQIDIGIYYILLIILVIVASSNAVNITDGLDGLAIGSVIMVSLSFCFLAYVTGHSVLSKYLLIPHIPKAGELTVFCSAILGASLGFLWFNCYPASIIMGDTGSLSLGGLIGIIAVLIKKELLLGLVGIIFVVEALSVILQVFSFKMTGRRIFKMSPLHHHFQMLKWNESKIIIRFWIVGIIFVIFTLLTLKLR